jgi:lysozyme
MALLDCVVDTSVYQGEIEPEKMAADGIVLAIIKASQGAHHVDRLYVRNSDACRAAGIRVIPYHLITAERWDAQLALFRKTAEAPIMALDWEMLAAGEPGSTLVAADVERMGKTLFAAGVKVLGYWGYKSAAPAEPTESMRLWDRWIPRYPWGKIRKAAECGLVRPETIRPVDPMLRFWQYTDGGKVDGIVGTVDRSLANFASVDELKRWLGP